MDAIQAIRGTRDILPSEVGYWQKIEQLAARILSQAGYEEIRPPIFEATSLFARGIGEATDVVGKEMYSFTDKSDRHLTLRPEGTASVVRAYIENKLYVESGVQRLWYAGPMFRYERPQAGRQRQFHQIGVELLGSGDPRADVEAIALATEILQNLGLKSLQLDINSVGNPEDRTSYRQALVNYLTPYKNELDKDSQERLSRNPLRILDSKEKKTQAIAQNAPSILDYLGEKSLQHFEKVQQLLTALGIKYTINPRLVRGLDYYTHTAFEIQAADLGAQATVCGGGRYDRLVQQLGGPETPAIGWAMGMERLILLLQKLEKPPIKAPDFYLVSRGETAATMALVLASSLRQLGFQVELDLSGSAFAKQLKRADRSKTVATLVLGEEEVSNKTVQLKWMASGKQQVIETSKLLAMTAELRSEIKQHQLG
ncbi:MAG: histidine--tRNA ligase [Gomphosphaeria aponina SAG 52.96 = DSM 107014]|uniref:Histidine--tRNA ligase n=1 Tax=Gomphosphaeria aponina SAG 52.96 = DSM 107014 TaxID=1521640 RepID=A0A941GXT6_9CHRO|nr:histidine--tRNA ligase [Gomphosphaeria aponina SAG 52.96 = DSM 107014]